MLGAASFTPFSPQHVGEVLYMDGANPFYFTRAREDKHAALPTLKKLFTLHFLHLTSLSEGYDFRFPKFYEKIVTNYFQLFIGRSTLKCSFPSLVSRPGIFFSGLDFLISGPEIFVPGPGTFLCGPLVKKCGPHFQQNNLFCHFHSSLITYHFFRCRKCSVFVLARACRNV